MKTWLMHNFGLKLFSIALAVVVWWLIQPKIQENRDTTLRSQTTKSGVTFP